MTLLKNLTQWGKDNLNPYSELPSFLKVINFLYNQTNTEWKSKSWYVYLSARTHSIHMIISYIWRYLKRPIISSSRILSSDSTTTFSYKDKKDNYKVKEIVISTLDFIKLLIQHIPEKFFKNIHYGWIFSNRCKSKYLHILNSPQYTSAFFAPKSFQIRQLHFTWIDPFLCTCGGSLSLFSATFNYNWNFITKFFDTS
jgi:hypothetical protein